MEARARRAAAAVGVAAAVVAAIGVFYLRPWHAFVPAPAPVAAPRTALTPTAMVQQMQFVSATVGWVVSGRPASSALFRTADGGRHWQHQLDGVVGLGWALTFFDARRGVVSGMDQRGPAVWRTTDGGERWTRVLMPCPELPVLATFTDLDHGWCLAPTSFTVSGDGPFPSRQSVALFRTADSGVHWSEVLETAPTRPVSHGLGDDGQKAWIWFRDAEVGWIGQRTSGGTVAVYATADGGADWSRQELPPPAGGWGPAAGMLEEGPQVVGDQAAPSVVVSPLMPGPQLRQFLGGGRYVYTWRPPSWTGPVLVPAGGILIADQARWYVENGSSLLETSDAGESWLALGQVPTGWRATRLAMVDRDHGWALLSSAVPAGPGQTPATGLARTDDGGRHWAMVAAPA